MEPDGPQAARLLVVRTPRLDAYRPELTDELGERAVRILGTTGHPGDVSALAFVGELTTSGSGDDFAELSRLVDLVEGRLIDRGAGELPVVLASPGLSDRRPIATDTAVAHALGPWWDTVNASIWSGGYADVVDALGEAYRNFLTWIAGHVGTSQVAHRGVIPGDGLYTRASPDACRYLVLNRSFRLEQPGAPDDGGDQMLQAAGAQITAEDVVVLVTSGSPVTRPVGPAPLVGISGDGVHVSGPAGWTEVRASPSGGSVALVDVVGRGDGSCDVRVLGEDGASDEGRALRCTEIEPERSRDDRAAAAEPDLEQAARRVERDLLRDMDGHLADGAPVLLLMSGIEGASVNEAGDPLVPASELARRLMQEDMGEVPDGEIPILDEVLVRRGLSASARAALLKSSLSEPSGGPKNPLATLLLRAPWRRVYDLTGTNVLENTVRNDPELFPGVSVVNAYVDAPVPIGGELEVVSLNGTVGDDSAPVTFVAGTPGGSTTRDRWFRELRTDLVLCPVVVMTDDTSSRQLWGTLESVGLSEPSQPRYLVAGAFSGSDRYRSRSYHLNLIAVRPAEFVRTRLATSRESVTTGRRRLARSRTRLHQGVGLQLLQPLVDDSGPGSDAFLRGNEPSWGDVRDRIAADFSRVQSVLQSCDDVEKQTGKRQRLILAGRAGSGKSTLLMQLGMHFLRKRKIVGWIDRSATRSLEQIRSHIDELDLDVVLVDDAEMFGNSVETAMRRFNRNGRTLVIATIRSTRSEILGRDPGGRRADIDTRPLTDADLDALLEVLQQNRLLGRLRGVRPASLRRARLREMSEGDLLAAMIEVVTGTPFDARIASEFTELKPLPAELYACACVLVSAVFECKEIMLSDLVQMAAESASEQQAYAALRTLVDQGMLIRTGGLAVRGRHRAISDSVLRHLTERPDHLARIVQTLLWHYASRAYQRTDRRDPYRRILIGLLSHSLMRRLKLPVEAVRSIYRSVHDLLSDDHHYWLQAARFEVEHDDLDLAASYLESARGCVLGEDDYKVRTALGEVTLRRSGASPDSESLFEAAVSALDDLRKICRTKGADSPHTFVVLAKEGYSWITSSSRLTAAEQAEQAQQLLEDVELGRRISDNSEFLRVADRYEPQLKRLRSGGGGIPI